MRDTENLRRLRREWYHRNREREAEKQRVRKLNRSKEITLFIKNLKESTPCTDCNKNYPACVMDFDHLRDKKFTISVSKANLSMKSLLAEIAKCEIVCANCHRLRTEKRRMEVV